MGRFPVVYRNSCQNQSVTPKTINLNGNKNLLRYIRIITIMVAFRNKLFRRPPQGLIVWIYQEMGRFSCGVRAQLPKSKCHTKNYWLKWVQESVKIHMEHSFYGVIPNKLSRRPPRGPIVWIYQEIGRFSGGVRAQLPKSKCYTKNYWLEWVQESVKIDKEHNYYGVIP